jgi:hypothetical protein
MQQKRARLCGEREKGGWWRTVWVNPILKLEVPVMRLSLNPARVDVAGGTRNARIVGSGENSVAHREVQIAHGRRVFPHTACSSTPA